MATERLPMRKTREILRLRRQQGLSVREMARALGVSVGVESKTASRAEKVGVSWEVAEVLDDVALEERLYGRVVGPHDDRPRPGLRRPGVTLELLHLQYLEQHPTGLRYSALCARAEGSHARLLEKLAKPDVLVLHDWRFGAPKDSERHDLLEVIEDRYGRVPTVVTSQLPVGKWHEWIGDPTMADANWDRLVNNTHKVGLKGPIPTHPETEPFH
jgi:hypothetical protein